MSKFKVGDRVVVSTTYPFGKSTGPAGFTGVVQGDEYVKFDGWTEGHSGMSDNYHDRDQWFIEDEYLTLAVTETPPAIIDPELAIITVIITALEALEDDAKERTLRYVKHRFGLVV